METVYEQTGRFQQAFGQNQVMSSHLSQVAHSSCTIYVLDKTSMNFSSEVKAYRKREGKYHEVKTTDATCKHVFYVTIRLESVKLDSTLRNTFVGKERGDLEPLVSLKLDDLSELFVVDKCSVTSKFLLKGLQQLLGVVFFRESLQRCQGLATISLLNTDMYVVLLGSNVFVVSKRITLVREWIVRVEILNAHATRRKD